nr:retrovirus-related Pol polyprotein from transposon TNT 1-94 [Tanacetum cinerariifolium]
MVIYNVLPRKEYERIFMCNTAKRIWNTLLITHQGNCQVKDNKIDLLVQQYEQFTISEDESIDNAFARFNTIITSLKALDEGYSSKNYVRKFLRALYPKWRAKVTAIEESKDVTSLSLDELIGNLKVHKMIIKKDSEIVKAKVERKSLALKGKKESSDEECSTSGSKDESMPWRSRDDKNDKSDRKCFRCGDPNHLIGECPKPPKNKNQRAFVRGSWSNSIEEDDEKVKNETCLVVQASSEICLGVDLEPDEWIKDSGCSKHMTGNRKLFSSYKAYNGGNVIFDSNLRGNIIGKGQICDNKCRVTFSEYDSEITKDGKVIGRGIIRNLPKLKFDQHFCDACKLGKQAHASHKANNIVSMTRCLELFHMDLFGPSSIRSYEGNRYTLVIYYDYSRKIEESFNVTFDETPPPSKTLPLVDDDLDEYEAIKISEKKNLENDIVDETLEIDEIVNIKESRNHPLENVIRNLNQRTLRSQAKNQSNFFCFISTIEPKNVNETLGDESWIVAMQEELNQFIANDVWELVSQPRNMTIIGTKWDIDYDETYAPIAKLESIRILLANVCALDFKLFQMDVKSAFLNIIINEEVYVAQPLGFIDFEKLDHVYKLKKALYGLKQAPKSWPDIMFSVCLCARFQEAPKTSHLEAVKRILRYIKGTTHLGLWYPKGTGIKTVVYDDSDHAEDYVDRKSTSGICTFVGCCLTSWFPKKQTALAISTTEAEYVSARKAYHGKKRLRESNTSSSSSFTTQNYPSLSLPLDATGDENDDESFHSHSSSSSQNISSSSNVVPRVRQNLPHESHDLNTYLSKTINIQTQQKDAHRDGLRSIGQAIKDMMSRKRH